MLDTNERDLLNGAFNVISRLDLVEPAHASLYVNYFEQVTSVIENIKRETIVETDKQYRYLTSDKVIDNVATVARVTPGRMCVTDLEEYLDDRGPEWLIAHDKELFLHVKKLVPKNTSRPQKRKTAK